jgi:predicted TIM-barrel fold metal-dependent hydrolase
LSSLYVGAGWSSVTGLVREIATGEELGFLLIIDEGGGLMTLHVDGRPALLWRSSHSVKVPGLASSVNSEDTTRRVVFVDIDGVLAPIRRWDRYGDLDPACIQVLNEIVARAGADVVVSSTWRHGKTVAELQEILEGQGFAGSVADKTPTGAPGADRGDEIAAWLAEHAVGSYVIIDDHGNMGALRSQLVLTHPARGLQPADAARAIAMLLGINHRRTGMLIVDSQIHLWQNGKMSAHHRQVPTYSIDDALAGMVSAGVDAAVIHPPSALGEAVNALAVEAARRHPDRFCILGHFDLQSPDRETIVARWRERPGMLGFRFTFNQPHQKAWWTDGSLDWFWAACEKAELPVGLLAGGNMAAVAKIAERHPCLKLHVDHLGRRGGGAGGTDDAAFADITDMLALAGFPNVAVKMSGAPSYSSQPYPYKNIHGYLRQIFEAFGPERSFWGTDITRMPCSYRQCVTMFTEELPWLRGRDLERVMGGAIVDWLGWKRPAAA